MQRPSSIPSLPADWPFTARPATGSEACLQPAELPGMGGGWTLHLPRPLDFEEAQGASPLAFGRGGVRRIGEVVMRPYRRGGLIRHLNERIYSSPARFARELAVHQALWLAGFPTVEPLGYGFRSRGWGVEGVYLTRYEPAAPWPLRWESHAEVVPQVARLLKALVRWGLFAPDLNATNFLVTDEGRVLALDWDRADWRRGEGLLPRYQERLERSLRKLGAPESVLIQLATSLAG